MVGVLRWPILWVMLGVGLVSVFTARWRQAR